MRKKLDEYRKRLRREQLDEKKDSMRWTMVEAIMREEKAEELDSSLRRWIEESAAREFIEAYESASNDIVFALPRLTIEEGYLCFSDDLRQNYHAAIIKDLLSNHAAVLLVSPRLQQVHNKVITWSIKQISQQVQNYQQDSTSFVENPLKILNIFLSRKNFDRLSIQDSQSFLLSILSWQEVLLHNKLFLQLFTSLLSNFLSTEHWENLEFDVLLFSLSRQTLAHNGSIAYFSLKVLNSLLSKLQNISEECMRELMPSYLGILERVFKGENTEKYLVECLNQLEKMLRVVRQQNWRIGLGAALQLNNTFMILSLINQIQHFPQRFLVYSIIEYSTHIIAEEQDSQSLLRLRKELQCTLLLGLGNRFSNQITLNSIRAIQVLLRSQLIGYQCRQAVISFEQEGIISFLEYLQYNRNNEVAWIAASLLDQEYTDRYQQIYQ